MLTEVAGSSCLVKRVDVSRGSTGFPQGQNMNELPKNKETLAAVRELIRYAIMTLSALRDPDRKYLGLAQMPVHIVHDVQQAYGYSSASVRSFRPTAQDITQMEFFSSWLAWLRRNEGEMALRRIIGWSMGAALWRLGQREGCSGDTIMNRINRSVSAMIEHFAGSRIEVEIVDEPYKGAVYAAHVEKAPGPHGECVLMKVYISDYGFMKGGKKVSSAQDSYKIKRAVA